MKSNREELLGDLAPFADLGTAPPIAVETSDGLTVRFSREGRSLELRYSSDGSVVESCDGDERRHLSFKALLASQNFANLGKWADSQKIFLRDRAASETIEISGRLADSSEEGSIPFVDRVLSNAKRSEHSVEIMLIDGPAGIGKTSFIRSLAYLRAVQFRSTQKPLVLHVESRGRMLQNITDLMAFSLQTLRLSITYDQIPTLVKHGLVTLAIDGFDELGDPNGYDLAWAQVNDLISTVRGNGTIILAGRETFIGLDKMRTVLTSVNPSVDELRTFTLQPLSANDAKSWLREKGWNEALFSNEAVTPLFEPNSYALRPFFLSLLAAEGVQSQILQGQITDLLSFLIKSMIVREATKFGRDIEAVTTEAERVEFITQLMQEIARDLADNQTDAVSGESVSWLAEVAGSNVVPESLLGILKNRAGVIAFLTEDDRRGYKRFIHEKVADYFLSSVAEKAIIAGEVPKFIRRNIIGMEFLETFCSAAASWTDSNSAKFYTQVQIALESVGDFDRSRRNLAALSLAASCSTENEIPLTINAVSLDEVFLTGTVHNVILNGVAIAQMFARGADLSRIQFDEDCHIVSLVADEGTVPALDMPLPAYIVLRDEVLSDPYQMTAWLHNQVANSHVALPPRPDLEGLISRLPLFELLRKLVRHKAYWIKDDDDDRPAKRIIEDPHWETLREVMIQHNLLSERSVPASGRPGNFYHVKNRESLLNLKSPPEEVGKFFAELLKLSINEFRRQRIDD